MLISGRQIKAARVLLDWSLEDLVKKSGITLKSLSQIENENVQPQQKTLSAIFSAFDRSGIAFLEDEGVKMRKQETRTYFGKTGYRQFLDHVYETLKDGGAIRQFNFGDMRFLPHTENFVTEHFERMSGIEGIDAKVLEQEGETREQVPYCSYRYMDKTYTDMAPWYLYGDFLAMSLNEVGAKREFVTVHSKFLAQRYLKEFDIFWNLAAEPRKKKGK